MRGMRRWGVREVRVSDCEERGLSLRMVGLGWDGGGLTGMEEFR